MGCILIKKSRRQTRAIMLMIILFVRQGGLFVFCDGGAKRALQCICDTPSDRFGLLNFSFHQIRHTRGPGNGALKQTLPPLNVAGTGEVKVRHKLN